MVGRLAASGVALALLAAACSSSSDDQALVVQECKDAVAAHLTYPADANFPFFDPNPSKDSAGTWHVNGTVKAENGFGGVHTVRWTCTVDVDDHVNASVGP